MTLNQQLKELLQVYPDSKTAIQETVDIFLHHLEQLLLNHAPKARGGAAAPPFVGDTPNE